MTRHELNTKALIFDFDGTLCELYTKTNELILLTNVLHDILAVIGITFTTDKDPYEVFKEIIEQTGTQPELRKKAFEVAHGVLKLEELEAIKHAPLLDGVLSTLEKLTRRGYLVGIVTNNAPECVYLFLKSHGIDIDFPVIGRNGTRPELMKPNGWPIIECINQLGCQLQNAIYIGDSPGDYHAAVNATCQFIGIATTEKRLTRLQQQNPDIKIARTFKEIGTILKSLNT